MYISRIGGRTRTRTWDPLIKRFLISQIFQRLSKSSDGQNTPKSVQTLTRLLDWATAHLLQLLLVKVSVR
jgi:hypothetical protein